MSESTNNTVHFVNKVPRVVDEAEKEASEVLHSLLSVERIEKPDNLHNIQHQVVVLNSNDDNIQWDNGGHCGVYTLDGGHHTYSHTENTVVWDNTLTLDVETTPPSDHYVVPEAIPQQTHMQSESPKNQRLNSNKTGVKKSSYKWQKKSAKPAESTPESSGEEIIVEGDGASDVRQRFRMGCECQDVSCFRGLNPDSVYKHRLNIAELTKEEHDMYLMGVTMACMSDPGVTVKHKERRRLRAQYVYQGRRVCLSAFLYLENCTLYQLKRIRKHVMTHGVTPRVHGNHGKKPHNVFSLETYRRATDFLKGYIEQHNTTTGNCKNTVIFPPEISRKTIHNLYQEYMKTCAPEEKTMGYSTFRHFMKEQFPHVRFCKVELGSQICNNSSNVTLKHREPQSHRGTNTEAVSISETVAVMPAPVTTIPVLIQEQSKPSQTYIVTPVSQLVQPYPTGAITVTPITNYAFTTL
ncbi:uncharacterized protein LOC124362474 isoform X2 [Homalodisca vitripennis]|uniref:Uncharacterized protein n=1 Tax=Homalodisca liturata TaxID=320908 RepID=A0A1B6HX87_9HEMI|nr:uncharacterized protein LOC124362474 isoform X2 [Homalodisca vitripennis]